MNVAVFLLAGIFFWKVSPKLTGQFQDDYGVDVFACRGGNHGRSRTRYNANPPPPPHTHKTNTHAHTRTHTHLSLIHI